MPGQANIFILLFGGLQGLLLVFFLLQKKTYRSGYGFLIAYLFVMIAQVVFKVMSKGWTMQNMGNWYSLSAQLPLLYGPLVLLFTREVLQQKKAQFSRDFIHFLPFAFIAAVIFYVQPYKVPAWVDFIYHRQGGLLFQLVSLFTYHYLAYRIWNDFAKSGTHASLIARQRMRWLRQFIVLSALVCGSISLLLFFMYEFYPSLHFARWGFANLTIFIYWISYMAINKPTLFTAIVNEDADKGLTTRRGTLKLLVQKPAEKYANSNLREEDVRQVLHSLEQQMELHRAYLDPQLNIDKLAGLVNTNRHLLSQILNERLHQSFHDYINHYRLTEAKRLLLDDQYAHQKIASIAYDAGFNSISVFNDAFKKFTGITPSAFRKNGEQIAEEKAG